MKHLFIINPAAGKGTSMKLIPYIEEIFKHRNEEYIIEITKGTGDATAIAQKYSSTGDYRIYSAGGDGTLNEVLNGVAGSSCSLGVIPSGSGNDFIKSIYNYEKSERIDHILAKTINGQEEFIDLCKFNDRHFINIASVGFDAEVAYNAIKFKKFRFIGGGLAYILGIIFTVFKYSSYDFDITIDDESFRVNALLMAVANGRYYGGGVNVTPEAEINDGLFSMCLVKKVSRLKILTLFPRVIKGTHAGIKEVSFHKGKKVKINCQKEIAFNIDGEISKGKKAEFEIISKGIKIVMPK